MSTYDHRDHPLIGARTPVVRVYTPHGAVYVPTTSEITQPQPIERETRRSISRRILTADGRQGIETTEEHDVVYGAPIPAQAPGRRNPVILAGIVAFILVSIAYTMLAGAEPSPAALPLYWIAFVCSWIWLAS